MPENRPISWLRRVLIVALCYCLAGQALLVQAASAAMVTGSDAAVICHGNGDPGTGDTGGNSLAKCHFCWLPASTVALLPDTGAGVATRIAVAETAYFVSFETIHVVRPPPRGASRAPPPFA